MYLFFFIFSIPYMDFTNEIFQHDCIHFRGLVTYAFLEVIFRGLLILLLDEFVIAFVVDDY